MQLPSQAQLNGRVLYTVLAAGPEPQTVYVAYVGTDDARAREVARTYHDAIVTASTIYYDARERGEE